VIENHFLRWISGLLPDRPEAVEAIRRSLAQAPTRIDDAHRELFSGYDTDPANLISITAELSNSDYPGLVVARDIPFLSTCAHHFLPFHGFVDVIYQPGPYIIGLGKLPRIVQCRAGRFQIQEFLVREIATDLVTHAKAKGAYVRAKAIHSCVCFRGPKSFSTTNVTSFLAGSITAPDFSSILNSLC
jgi:GTP cyclohydrolase I